MKYRILLSLIVPLARVAEEKQNVLKQNIQIQDYKSELLNVTNINAGDINVEPINASIEPLTTLDAYHSNITANAETTAG
ncbi:hypothetical protein SAMN05518672_101396 [Chitinophaga sp. CF118]|uniref:hypothetical protein n=1 Tax=Chitinophaga sp. CF118 TaxID=1884367 RepID=UPI0008EEACA9|nr:hypothetical protein [Chitinophaga sp. CF118]SFD08670.1 hypothetical protein SAMN05518672_101396 [Chitinophaga sp. CF118]